MILEKVADGRTKKEMEKVSAVVDSGAEANALPENMMQWIPLKPSGERSHPCARREVGDRLRGLPGEASSLGNEVYLDEDKAFAKNNKTEQITNLRENYCAAVKNNLKSCGGTHSPYRRTNPEVP